MVVIIPNPGVDKQKTLDVLLHDWADSLAQSLPALEIRQRVFEHAIGRMALAHETPAEELLCPQLKVASRQRRIFELITPIELAMALGRWEESKETAGRGRRRKRGVYYTPMDVAAPIIEVCVESLLNRAFSSVRNRQQATNAAQFVCDHVRICDPACGAGNFLLACLERFDDWLDRAGVHDRASWRRQFATRCLHGIDIDPVAVRVSQLLLWLIVGDDHGAPGDIGGHIMGDDALLGDPGDWTGKFDAVIGNPPFVDSETTCASAGGKAWRRKIAARYESARGNWDASSIFVERGLELVKPDGRLGFVLPRRILGSDHAAGVQTIMRRQTIERIDVVGDEEAFDGASVAVVRIFVRKERAGAGHTLRIGRTGRRMRLIEQASLGSLPPGHWSIIVGDQPATSIPAGDVDWAASLLRNWHRLGEIAQVSDGATTSEAYAMRELIHEAIGDHVCAGECVKLINTGTIDPFRTLWGSRTTRYLSRRYVRPIVALSSLRSLFPRRAQQAQCAKVMVAGLAGRLEAVADEGFALCGKSAVLVIPLNADRIDAISAWLNAQPITDLYRALFGCRSLGRDSLSIGSRQLALLPVPTGLKSDEQDDDTVSALNEIGIAMRAMEVADPARGLMQRQLNDLVRGVLMSTTQGSPTSCALVGTR